MIAPANVVCMTKGMAFTTANFHCDICIPLSANSPLHNNPASDPANVITKRPQITTHGNRIYRCLQNLWVVPNDGGIEKSRVADDLDEDDGGADVGSREAGRGDRRRCRW